MKFRWIAGALISVACAQAGCASRTPAKDANTPVVSLAAPTSANESRSVASRQATSDAPSTEQATGDDKLPPRDAAVGTMFGSSKEEGESFGYGGLDVAEGVSGGVPGDPLGGPPNGHLSGSTSTTRVGNSIDKEMIRRIVRMHMGEVRKCYENALKTNPNLEGRVVLKFTIAKSGDVIAVSIAHSTMNDPSVDNCIAANALTWRFPEHPGPAQVIIYPFIFKSA